ncbi:hypothetical protein Tco_0806202 [Tanacetum coccineum]
MAAFEKRRLDEDVEKLVDGDEESSANEFADMVLLDDEDSRNRIEPESHKDKSDEVANDDDEEKKDDVTTVNFF